MEHIAHKVRAAYPQFTFIAGTTAYWSPRDRTIHYAVDGTHSLAGLLHELAHGILQHTTYHTDLELLHKEITAWELAQSLAKTYDTHIDAEHIQDCLDTYRDWLHKRSTCPVCHMNGLQADIQAYNCLNCGHTWHVSSSRFCRPYRRSTHTKKDRSTAPVLSRFV
jgi:hypothetical protein